MDSCKNQHPCLKSLLLPAPSKAFTPFMEWGKENGIGNFVWEWIRFSKNRCLWWEAVLTLEAGTVLVLWNSPMKGRTLQCEEVPILLILKVAYLSSCNRLTEWNKVLEELIVVQLVTKFVIFHGTWRSITVFITAHQCTVSFESNSHLNQFLSRSVWILSSHWYLGLPVCLFSSRLQSKILYAFVIFPYLLHTLSVTNFWFGCPNNIWWWVQIMKLVLCPPLTFLLLVHIPLQFVLRHSQSMLGEDCEECQPSWQLIKSSEIMIYIYMLEPILLYYH